MKIAIEGEFVFNDTTLILSFGYRSELGSAMTTIEIFAGGLNRHAPIEIQREAVKWMRANRPAMANICENLWGVP